MVNNGDLRSVYVRGENAGTINVIDCHAPGGARNDRMGEFNEKSLGNDIFTSQAMSEIAEGETTKKRIRQIAVRLAAVAMAVDRGGDGDLRSVYVRGKNAGTINVIDCGASLAMTKKWVLNEKTAINAVSLVK